MPALHLEFVSSERVLFSGDVDQVDLPGVEGDLGILADHAPLVTGLRPGLVIIHRGGAREPIVLSGGFAEVSPAGLTILAEKASPRAEFDIAKLEADIQNTEEDVADATDAAERDRLVQRLEQLKKLQAALAHQ